MGDAAPTSSVSTTSSHSNEKPIERIEVQIANRPEDIDKQLDYLYKALDDAQSIVRHLDVKAGFGVAVLSAMIDKVLTNLGRFIPWTDQPFWVELLFGAFAISALASIIIAFRVVFPTSNPSRNVTLDQPKTMTFYVAELNPRRWLRFISSSPRFSTLEVTQSEFVAETERATSEVILGTLSAEVLKVSYIRQIKYERLKALAAMLFFNLAFFVGIMIANSSKPVNLTQPLQRTSGRPTSNAGATAPAQLSQPAESAPTPTPKPQPTQSEPTSIPGRS